MNGVSLRVTCPRRTQVISGGVQLAGGFTNDEVHIVGSFPFDGRDRGKSPDDGWIGRVNNYSGKELSMRTYAICTRGLDHEYKSGSNLLSASVASVEFRAFCDEGDEVVGGGASISGRSALFHMAYSTPADDVDADLLRNDGWEVSITNRSGVEQIAKIFVICTTTNLSHRSVTDAAPVTGNFAVLASACAADRILVGGGVQIEASEDEFMVGTRSFHGPDDTTSTDDGWAGYSSVATDPVDMTVTAICLPV